MVRLLHLGFSFLNESLAESAGEYSHLLLVHLGATFTRLKAGKINLRWFLAFVSFAAWFRLGRLWGTFHLVFFTCR